MQEWLQPYVSTIVQALLGLLTTFVLAGLYGVKQRVFRWIDAKTAESQRATLHGIAEEAFSYAETSLRGSAGPWKMEAAAGYANERLGALGMSLTNAEVQAAIEKAVLAHNAKVKPPSANRSAAASTVTESGTGPVQADLPSAGSAEASRAG